MHISRTDRRNASRQGRLPLMRSARQSRAVGRLLVARKVPTSKPPRVTRLNLSWLIRQDRLRSLTTEQGSSYARNEIFRNCQALSDVRGRRREIVGWIEPTSRQQTHPYSALTSILPGTNVCCAEIGKIAPTNVPCGLCFRARRS